MSAKPKILCVDDETDLLDGLRLNLRKVYRVSIASSGPDGLAQFDEARANEEPFDAVVSDMRMPQMNGAEFLTKILERSPQTPRILLSGQADIESTIAAINDAKIYRFLTKPCPPQLLQETLNEAMELERLRYAERELLDSTLRGTVGMLTEVLGLVSPAAYSRTIRIGEIVSGLCEALEMEPAWNLDIAAMLSQVGCVVVSEDEPAEPERHATLAAELLERIPRLEGVADIIRHQMDPTPPTDVGLGEWSPAHVQREILRASVMFERVLASGTSRKDAIAQMKVEALAPFVLEALERVRPSSEAMVEAQIGIAELVAGMELTDDLLAQTGTKLAGAGTPITSVLLQRLQPFIDAVGVAEPISVLAPASALTTARLR
ncbi:MAG: response regulator [Acidimicrobiia bacterium]|nr:response regulator [Acidimicrobiia bacterium]